MTNLQLFNVHTHKALSFNEVQNCFPSSSYEGGRFSVGIHPCYIENPQDQWQQLLLRASFKECVAIGECGLDKRASTSITEQISLFEKHIKLSEELCKPLLIHCVRSYAEIIYIYKRLKPKQLWVLHGFHKNESTALSLLNVGIKLSFGEALLYDQRLQLLGQQLDVSDFFLETDESSLPIEKLYQLVALWKKSTPEKLSEVFQTNFFKQR